MASGFWGCTRERASALNGLTTSKSKTCNRRSHPNKRVVVVHLHDKPLRESRLAFVAAKSVEKAYVDDAANII